MEHQEHQDQCKVASGERSRDRLLVCRGRASGPYGRSPFSAAWTAWHLWGSDRKEWCRATKVWVHRRELLNPNCL